jgi:hypothetical protein
MTKRNQTPPPEPECHGGPGDGLDRWDAEAADNDVPSDLPLVRLDDSQRWLILFTTQMLSVEVHYLDSGGYRGYLHCTGEDCILCRLDNRLKKLDLLPVYDVADAAVAVLPISPSVRPQALRPQIAAVLHDLQAGEDAMVVGISKDVLNFRVVRRPLLRRPRARDLRRMAAFAVAMASGGIDLGRAIQRLSNEELAGILEIRRVARVLGVVP